MAGLVTRQQHVMVVNREEGNKDRLARGGTWGGEKYHRGDKFRI